MRLLLIAALLLAASPAEACRYYKTTHDKEIRWPGGKCEIEYFVDVSGIEGVVEDFETVQAAIAKWSDLECSLFQFLFAGLTQDAKVEFDEENLDDNENHVVFIKSGWNDAIDDLSHENAIALTRLSFIPKTGELVDADLMLNLEKKDFSSCESAEDLENPKLYDLSYVILHEAGHMTGLDHSKDSLSVMFVQEATCPDEPMHYLTADDKECFCEYYGSADFTEACLNPPVDSAPEPTPEALPESADTLQQDAGPLPDSGDRCACPDCCCRLDAAGPAGSAPSFVVLLLVSLAWFTLRRPRPAAALLLILLSLFIGLARSTSEKTPAK